MNGDSPQGAQRSAVATRFIVRLQGRPLRFPRMGVPVLWECVPTDEDATGFGSKEEAITVMMKRGLSVARAAIVEKPDFAGRGTDSPQRHGGHGVTGEEGAKV